jgi:hypothetical protein
VLHCMLGHNREGQEYRRRVATSCWPLLGLAKTAGKAFGKEVIELVLGYRGGMLYDL